MKRRRWSVYIAYRGGKAWCPASFATRQRAQACRDFYLRMGYAARVVDRGAS